MPPLTLDHYEPATEPWLNILYQDDDILVINKPSDILSVPGRLEAFHDSIKTRALRDFRDARIVHRLDLATSGVMVLPLNAYAHKHIGLQFEKRRTKKSYKALVCGELKEESGSVDLPLICDWENRPKQMVDHENGKKALTHYQNLGTEMYGEHTVTRVALEPFTGRSHQLRVHMLSLGHAILGDPLYSDPEQAPRLMLHAETLSITHPTTKEFITFTADLPF